jgi:hypothetical protein
MSACTEEGAMAGNKTTDPTTSEIRSGAVHREVRFWPIVPEIR